MQLIFVAVLALATGVCVGWLVARPALERLRAEIDRERAVQQERVRAFENAEARLRDAFGALSADALKSNNEAFLQLAQTRLEHARSQATTDIESRKKAIEDLLAPMAKTLDQVDREIKEAERRRLQNTAELGEKIAALATAGQGIRTETQRLVDALKRPGVRGRWGELQLRRVVELAGMVERCDFDQQHSIAADDRRLRPDLIVRLPGGKLIVVDSKAPLDAYLRALDAPDEAGRQALLADHARQVRTHVAQLASKSYAAHITPTPDFVVMFLPGEMFFSAALEQDPDLIEYGVSQRVFPASPTTLIALLRAVAFGWQQEAVAENAHKISDLGRLLYDSLRTLANHMDDVGSRLKSSVDAYNKAVGSLERNVLVKARRFKDLQATNGDAEVKVLEPVEAAVRMLQAPELVDRLPIVDAEGTPEEEVEPA